MLLSQIIGVAPVLLGMANFHATFSVVLQWTGRFFSLLMPFAPGPRHWGQFSARAGMQSVRHNARGFGVRKRDSPFEQGYHAMPGAHSDRNAASNGERSATAVAITDAAMPVP